MGACAFAETAAWCARKPGQTGRMPCLASDLNRNVTDPSIAVKGGWRVG
jgi:hypothetical protein